MYYVVRLSGIKEEQKHYVFPVSWMRDCGSQLEKFVRNRINKNQMQIFFWSNEKNENGEPNGKIRANFNLPIQNSFPSTIDGCYYGQPVDFYCDYEAACNKLPGLRPVAPGLYNEARLLEAPLPNLVQNTTGQNVEDQNNQPNESNGSSSTDSTVNGLNDANEAHENQKITIASDSNLVRLSGNMDEIPEDIQDGCAQSSNDLDVSSSSDGATLESNNTNIVHENEHGTGASSSNSVELAENINDIVTLVVSSSIDSALNQTNGSVPSNSNSVSIAREHEMKPELHSLQRADVIEIDALLNLSQENAAALNEESDSDSEVEIIIVNGVFPKPVQYSVDGMLKREDDPISGDWAFAEAPQKNGNRIYKVGSKMVEIKKQILDKILEWMTPPYDESERLDQKLVAALLLACVGVEKLAKNEIEDEVMLFIKKIMGIRTKSCEIRLNAIEKYRHDICSEWKRKLKE